MKKTTLLVIAFLALIATYSNAQEEKYIGLFVYNFTKYFNWPESLKTNDFVIEVLGHKSVFMELEKICMGKSYGSQSIVVRHLSSPDQITSPHILFFGHWQTRHIETVKSKISETPTLLITENEGLINNGAIINFIIRDGTIKFEFNTVNAKKAGLQFTPEIRQLAANVVD